MNEFGGGDNFAVTFYNLATERPPTDGDASRLTGNVIGVSIPTPTVTITTQPQNTTVYAGTRAEFVVAAQSDSEIPLSYQWRRGSVEITNATSATYSLVASASDNAAQFDCVVSVAGLAPVTSAAATLTVQT